MRILITNDDGIRAPGIAALAEALSQDHDVYVYAPQDEKSGVGHSFTFLHPLRLYDVEKDHYYAAEITGTPVDCVKLGIYHMRETWDIEPDCIVSGINRGANLGTDVLYSGTASAAMEACLLGYPALAVSCCGRQEPLHYETAARYANKVIEQDLIFSLPALTMMNLNVPDIDIHAVKGIRVCRLGVCNYSSDYKKRIDPRGNAYYWLDDTINPTMDAESDIYWMDQAYATITPVSSNMTDDASLDALKIALEEQE